MLSTFDEYSYEISVFYALLCEDDENRADETPNVIADNTLPEADIDNKESAGPKDDTKAQLADPAIFLGTINKCNNFVMALMTFQLFVKKETQFQFSRATYRNCDCYERDAVDIWIRLHRN